MCKCCEEIKFWKESNQYGENMTSKLFAKLAIYTWKKGEKKIRRNRHGQIITNSYELKYCPLCGEKQ